MLVDNTVFYDGRHPTSLEAANRFITFCSTSHYSEKRSLFLRDASVTHLADLSIRFGYPYRLFHQGGCMHSIVFQQARHVTFDQCEMNYILIKLTFPIFTFADCLRILKSWSQHSQSTRRKIHSRNKSSVSWMRRGRQSKSIITW